MLTGVCYIRKGKKGKNREADCVAAKPDKVEVSEGHAGHGPALRIAFPAKGNMGEHVVLVDDNVLLREIINTCEAVLSKRPDPVEKMTGGAGWVIQEPSRKGWAVNDPIEGWIFTTVRTSATKFPTKADAEKAMADYYKGDEWRTLRVVTY